MRGYVMGLHGPNCMWTNGGWLLPCSCGKGSNSAEDERGSST